MQPADIVAIIVILLIVGAATAYIIKAKKSGRKCIGCPDSKTCSGSCSSWCGCSGNNHEKTDQE